MSDMTQDLNFLQGVKVVDFTQFEAGTTSTEVLAWFGAEVVKIENPGRGDPGPPAAPRQARRRPLVFPPVQRQQEVADDQSEIAEGARHRQGDAEEGRRHGRNMAPGTIERLGLDTNGQEVNPRIIYCQIKGFGTGSPHEKGLAFDMIAQAAGGPISVTGEPGRPPVKPGLCFGDTGTGMLMAATMLGALHERNRTGQGSAAGGDAGCDGPLHAHLLCQHGAHRPAGAA